ncbi:MAG: SDR family oxidoreductase [Clostridia bacterium]|nr:SDR family oxidoreductase [Clostridia bacterium]
MPKTVIITGSSSGIGLETALLFAGKGWNVVATMRQPEKSQSEFLGKNNIELQYLDVQDHESIKNVMSAALKKYKTIDAVINNAGYALVGPFELSEKDQILKQYKTNVLGLMDVTREIIPIFRKQGFGTIVNISSIGGRVVFPYYSLYHGTKWAVEGFSESLHYELRPFNIRVKLVEPGIIKTNFYNRSMERIDKDPESIYREMYQKSEKKMGSFLKKGSHPSVISKTIYKAVDDGKWKLRYAAGSNASMILMMRKILPDFIFHRVIRRMTF